MTLITSSTKWTAAFFALLVLLVVGAMTWATTLTIRSVRADQAAAGNADLEQRIRLAVTEMESYANQMLFFNEFARDYWHYAPFHQFKDVEVRFLSGELLAPSVVGASPLFLSPPEQPWVMLHFQSSPVSGFSSPQLMPRFIRHWPGFEADYDTWDRSWYYRRLAALEASLTAEDLAELYRQSRYVDSLGARHNTDDDRNNVSSPSPAPSSAHVASKGASNPMRKRELSNDIEMLRNRAQRLQRVQTPPAVCAPEHIAFANIFQPDQIEDVHSSTDYTGDEAEVICGQMRPAWVQLPGRNQDDLIYLRPVSLAGQTAWQGFVLDWPAFSATLLQQVSGIFDSATLDPLTTADAVPPDFAAFSTIPARLNPNEEPQLAAAGWNRTYTFLLVGWAGVTTLLAAVGLGLLSMVRLSNRRSHFAYAVTHELRTPLTTFRLYTDMLNEGLVRPEDHGTYIKTLNDESKRLADLVNGVLEYSRIENSNVPINKEPVRLGELLKTIGEFYQSRCESADMRLSINVDGVADYQVMTDRQLALQVIGNLVDNACKYGRNADHPVIEVSAAQRDGNATIEVRDHGPGVPPRKRASIFRPYNRAETEPATAVGGVGLGLALSRSWAKLLGGHLELVHEPQRKGATFRVTLGPLQPANKT